VQYIPAGDISFYSHVCVTRLGVPVPELIKPRFRIQDLDLLPLPHRIVFEIAGDEDGSRRVSDLENRGILLSLRKTSRRSLKLLALTPSFG
jgi:hypothetical protein